MFIEQAIKERQFLMYGQYHPKDRRKSCVMVKHVGCVFIGTVEQCQEYIRLNRSRYERRENG